MACAAFTDPKGGFHRRKTTFMVEDYIPETDRNFGSFRSPKVEKARSG